MIEYCNKINEAFNSLLMLTELYKSQNEEVIKILNDTEHGR